MSHHPRKSGALALSAQDWAELPVLERQWRRLPFVDRETGDLSITRVIAFYFAALIGHLVEQSHTLSWSALWLALAVLAAAFGKSTFGFLLTRVSLSTQGTQIDQRSESHTVNEQVTRVIEERRDPSLGIEVSP